MNFFSIASGKRRRFHCQRLQQSWKIHCVCICQIYRVSVTVPKAGGQRTRVASLRFLMVYLSHLLSLKLKTHLTSLSGSSRVWPPSYRLNIVYSGTLKGWYAITLCVPHRRASITWPRNTFSAPSLNSLTTINITLQVSIRGSPEGLETPGETIQDRRVRSVVTRGSQN